jgi:hypothetical protein
LLWTVVMPVTTNETLLVADPGVITVTLFTFRSASGPGIGVGAGVGAGVGSGVGAGVGSGDGVGAGVPVGVSTGGAGVVDGSSPHSRGRSGIVPGLSGGNTCGQPPGSADDGDAVASTSPAARTARPINIGASVLLICRRLLSYGRTAKTPALST